MLVGLIASCDPVSDACAEIAIGSLIVTFFGDPIPVIRLWVLIHAPGFTNPGAS